MDTLFLHGFKIDTLIGVYEWERQQPQSLLLDIDMDIDLQPAARSDDVVDTIHYGHLAELLRSQLAQQQFYLLEALAEFVAELILGDYAAKWVRVRVVKPGILPHVREVGIQIERHSQNQE